METKRIIPRLDIKGPNLVKGIHLEGLRVLGKPEYFAEHYYENGADELIFMDVVASLYERNSLHDIIKRVAKKIHIPLTVGGGIRTIEDITAVLRAGADRVSINTAAIKNPKFLDEAVKTFGSSTIVVTTEAIKQSDGNYFAFVDNAREQTGKEVMSWIKELNEIGVGEVIITSVDKEGTGEGFDVEFSRRISEAAKMSVLANGGAGKKEHVNELLSNTNVSGAVLASVFHYFIANSLYKEEDGFTEGNLDFIKKMGISKLFNPESITDLKKFLKMNGQNIRSL
jgi:cyclase